MSDSVANLFFFYVRSTLPFQKRKSFLLTEKKILQQIDEMSLKKAILGYYYSCYNSLNKKRLLINYVFPRRIKFLNVQATYHAPLKPSAQRHVPSCGTQYPPLTHWHLLAQFAPWLPGGHGSPQSDPVQPICKV